MAGPDRLPYGTSLSDQLSLIVSVVLFVTLLVSVTGYLAFHAVVIRIARRLRAPPTQLNENIKQAIDRFRSKLGNTDSSSGLGPNGTAATDPYIMLPAYGNKTAAVRRRLILASRNPASYNTYFGSRRIKLAPVDARAEPLFQPAYHKQGSPSERKIIYGFFHPYANAGGGGERVLWAAVKATLEQSERNICVIYTGLDPPPAPAPVSRAELLQKSGNDRVGQFTDVNRPERILEKARARFGLEIEDPSRVVFIYLTKRKLVDPATWPRLTLLLQAAGSAVLAYEALTTLIPDVWVDTMGYPFTYPLVSWLANIPIAAYVHYPVISTDMITGMVRSTPAGIKKAFKYLYWSAFAWAYTLWDRTFLSLWPTRLGRHSTSALNGGGAVVAHGARATPNMSRRFTLHVQPKISRSSRSTSAVSKQSTLPNSARKSVMNLYSRSLPSFWPRTENSMESFLDPKRRLPSWCLLDQFVMTMIGQLCTTCGSWHMNSS